MGPRSCPGCAGDQSRARRAPDESRRAWRSPRRERPRSRRARPRRRPGPGGGRPRCSARAPGPGGSRSSGGGRTGGRGRRRTRRSAGTRRRRCDRRPLRAPLRSAPARRRLGPSGAPRPRGVGGYLVRFRELRRGRGKGGGRTGAALVQVWREPFCTSRDLQPRRLQAPGACGDRLAHSVGIYRATSRRPGRSPSHGVRRSGRGRAAASNAGASRARGGACGRPGVAGRPGGAGRRGRPGRSRSPGARPQKAVEGAPAAR